MIPSISISQVCWNRVYGIGLVCDPVGLHTYDLETCRKCIIFKLIFINLVIIGTLHYGKEHAT